MHKAHCCVIIPMKIERTIFMTGRGNKPIAEEQFVEQFQTLVGPEQFDQISLHQIRLYEDLSLLGHAPIPADLTEKVPEFVKLLTAKTEFNPDTIFAISEDQLVRDLIEHKNSLPRGSEARKEIAHAIKVTRGIAAARFLIWGTTPPDFPAN